MNNVSSVVSSIHDKLWNKRLPVDIDAIAKLLDIHIEPQVNERSGTAEHVDGQYVIRYNDNEAPVRQRFTKAHELGHIMLRHNLPKQRNDRLLNDSDETEANRFAAELLMPASLLDIMVFKNGVSDVSILADAFGVSTSAMAYRLKNLGII